MMKTGLVVQNELPAPVITLVILRAVETIPTWSPGLKKSGVIMIKINSKKINEK